MNETIWLPYPEFPDHYLVSNDGRVRRILRTKGTATGLLKPWTSATDTYPRVSLCVRNHTYKRLVHRMVASAFLGPIIDPSQYQVNHKDGDRYNAHIDNLEYVTPKQNNAHARDVLGSSFGTGGQGVRKLTPSDISRIRRARGYLSALTLSKIFHRHQRTIRRIWNNETYSRLI